MYSSLIFFSKLTILKAKSPVEVKGAIMEKDNTLESNTIETPSSSAKLKALIDILIVLVPLGTILFARYIFDQEWIGFIGSLAMIGWLLWVLKWRGHQLGDIGMARPASLLKTVLFGVVITIAAIIVQNVIQGILATLLKIPLPETDVSRFAQIPGNLPLLLIWLFRIWTAVAFGEEMIFRGFLMHRLEILIGDVRLKGVLAAVGSSVIFGFAHFYLGISGIFSTGLIGLTFALSYLLTKRNLWSVIVAHGVGDSVGFFLIYLGLIDLVT